MPVRAVRLSSFDKAFDADGCVWRILAALTRTPVLFGDQIRGYPLLRGARHGRRGHENIGLLGGIAIVYAFRLVAVEHRLPRKPNASCSVQNSPIFAPTRWSSKISSATAAYRAIDGPAGRTLRFEVADQAVVIARSRLLHSAQLPLSMSERAGFRRARHRRELEGAPLGSETVGASDPPSNASAGDRREGEMMICVCHLPTRKALTCGFATGWMPVVKPQVTRPRPSAHRHGEDAETAPPRRSRDRPDEPLDRHRITSARAPGRRADTARTGGIADPIPLISLQAPVRTGGSARAYVRGERSPTRPYGTDR